MLRYLAAIGMNRMVDQKELNRLLTEVLQEKPEHVVRYNAPGTEKKLLEIPYVMGPFQLILRGYMLSPTEVHLFAIVPQARPGTVSTILNWQYAMEGPDLYAFGEEESSGGVLEVMLSRTGRILALHGPTDGEKLKVAYTGLSIEGKILLGVERTDEDLKRYEEEEKWHQEMLSKARSGDEYASREIDEAMDLQDEEIEERLKHEDLFTILEGIFVPADETTTSLYQVMGTILDMDKVLNPVTEEWVYHLQLDVMGSPLDVYIHPNDLVGAPAKGRRFLGKVRLIGDVLKRPFSAGM